MAGDSSSAGGDPYATSKANLRDTVKWLGGIFGALAAAVVAGAPLSGLGALDPVGWRLWVALAMLLGAFFCVCIALATTLNILRADFLYDSDIDPDRPIAKRRDADEIKQIRDSIAEHANDLFPQYKTYRVLLNQINAADANAQALESAWQAARADGNSSADDIAQAKADYDLQITALQDFRSLQSDILYYGAYLRFYNRLQTAQPRLFKLGIGALVLLTAFAVVSHKPEENKAPPALVIPVTVAASSPDPQPARAVKLVDIHFATGSSVVSPEGIVQAGRARDAAAARPDTVIMLMAYTDTVGGKVNVDLARQRAEAVRQLLTGPGGLAAARVYSSELPKSALPNVTANQVQDPSNRSVSIYLMAMQR